MKTIDTTRFFLLTLSLVFAAGLLFVNIYNSVVDAANWGSLVPNSIEAARAYYKNADPGTFYRIASPLNQLIGLLALVFCWKLGPRMRLLCGIALAVAVANDMFTFAYFFPRNAVLFEQPVAGNLDAIRHTASEWIAMNWVRSATVAVNVGVSVVALATFLRGLYGSATTQLRTVAA
ncbi:MAG: hypothetical protein HONBIEJF_00777 [Fimbriimonadaceae bacterium]|nr:hypothetical protein [Fimbriimonadaceae bacterium]